MWEGREGHQGQTDHARRFSRGCKPLRFGYRWWILRPQLALLYLVFINGGTRQVTTRTYTFHRQRSSTTYTYSPEITLVGELINNIWPTPAGETNDGPLHATASPWHSRVVPLASVQGVSVKPYQYLGTTCRVRSRGKRGGKWI
ncbi:hypothetical protein M405DRAFT_132730 [Rhizopogon salebrosus TDB-379]|nr:hypothetical protein M405DRAFT_132730 [Rhizopogon salebrosus TDB-379]